jgi:hypothetical protein
MKSIEVFNYLHHSKTISLLGLEVKENIREKS